MMRRWFWSSGFSFLWLLFPAIAQAQVTADGTLPTSVSSPDGLNFTIDAGVQVGGNLFHSFQTFSVPTGGSAIFNNAIVVQNIIGRVTGGSLSSIDGLVAANGTANLFLINPRGIVFGPNATLNIGGSLIASTANQVQFADGTEFSAVNSTTPLLTVSIPVGLQIGSDPAAIRVQGDGNNLILDGDGVVVRDFRPPGLEVLPGKAIALVGGDIWLEGGNLTAPAGRVELGSVAGGTVRLNPVGTDWSLSYEGVTAFRDIQLTQAAAIDTSGSSSGAIQVQGRSLFLRDGSAMLGYTLGNQSGADLVIRATESVELTGANSFGTPSVLGTRLETGAIGNAGNIRVQANNALLQNGAIVTSETFGTGNSGSITFTVAQLTDLSGLDEVGFSSLISTLSTSPTSGNAGEVTLLSDRLQLRDGAQVSSVVFGRGNSSNVTVRAADVELSGTSGNGLGSFLTTRIERGAIGNAGNLTIETDRLLLRDGANVSSSSSGRGNGGNLIVRASDTVALSGSDVDGRGSILTTQVNSVGVGNAGNLAIATNRLLLQDGTTVSSSTFGRGNGGNLTIQAKTVVASGIDARGVGSYIVTQVNPTGVGNAGNVTIEANQLQLQDGAVVTSATLGRGNGGDLTIRAGEVLLSGADAAGRTSFLTTQVGPTGVGNAGDLSIEANSLQLQDSTIVSSATFGRGNSGDLTIRASTIALSGVDSRGGSLVTTQVAPTGVGNAGDLSVDTGRLILQDGAGITSMTSGIGDGGKVTIRAAETVELSGLNGNGLGSRIETMVARGARGNAGVLTLETGRLRLQDQAAITSATEGIGNANNLTVQARDSIFLTDNSRLSAQSQGSGEAGSLAVTTNRLTLENGSQFIVSSQGAFPAGNLSVSARSIRLNNQASFRAETEAGDRGSIFITARDVILRRNSMITANATNTATGGNITINSDVLVLAENSAIVAQAVFGRGGNITITTQGLFQLPGTRIDASSELGINGNVQINSPDIDPNRLLVELPAELIDSQQLISNSCLIPSSRQQGSFVLSGMGGLPAIPTNPLRAPFETYAIPSNTAQSSQTHSTGLSNNSITEIENIYRLENGQFILGRRCP